MKRMLNTLYVTNKDAFVCKKDDNVCVRVDGKDALKVSFHLLEGIVLFGYAGASSPLMYECAKRGIAVSILDEKGRFAARVEGPISGNVLLRKEQYSVAADPCRALALSKMFMAAKFANTRFVLQKQMRDYPELADNGLSDAASAQQYALERAKNVSDFGELLGIEGDAARTYFSAFSVMLRKKEIAKTFSGRNRRPPKDPANAALSFYYSMLSREISTACETAGLDPQMGFYHQPRPGRMSLALDVLEEFRAPLVDRFVLSLFNRGQLSEGDFQYDAEGGCFFTDAGLKSSLDAWQRRKQDEVRHPFLGEKVPVGLLPFVQAKLLSRYLRGDLDGYPVFLWR